MTIRFLLTRAGVSVAVAGIALGTFAQTPPSAVEQPAAAQDRALIESAFSKADTNGDGKLTRAEAAQLPAIAARFDLLDKDKDGTLSLEEFAAGFIAPD